MRAITRTRQATLFPALTRTGPRVILFSWSARAVAARIPHIYTECDLRAVAAEMAGGRLLINDGALGETWPDGWSYLELCQQEAGESSEIVQCYKLRIVVGGQVARGGGAWPMLRRRPA